MIANLVGRAVTEVTLAAEAISGAAAVVARRGRAVIANVGCLLRRMNDDRVVARSRPVHGAGADGSAVAATVIVAMAMMMVSVRECAAGCRQQERTGRDGGCEC